MPKTKRTQTATILPVHFCAFCGRDVDTIGKAGAIVLGPRMVGICDHCVDVCVDIIAKYRATEEAKDA